jgi:hypothetical protein
MKKISLLAAAAMASAAMLLGACGGSDDEPAPVAEDPTVVPTSATASVTAWVNFAKALMSSDSAEALALSNISTLPVSDTDEPLPLAP